MSKRVLDVGNCGPDHSSIRDLIQQHFDAEVVQTHGLDDTLSQLRQNRFDLVLINRKLDRDYSDGLKILQDIKKDTDLSAVPVMLITNYDDHQQVAVQAGAVEGFGKLALREASTVDKLAEWLQ